MDLLLLDTLPDAIFVVRDEAVVWANQASRELLGAGLVGRSFEDVLAGGQRLRLELLLKQRAEGWTLPATCRLRFVHETERKEIVADVRVGENNHGLILSARDITDQTRAEELMGQLAGAAARGDAPLDAETLLDAASPTFLALGWVVAYTELVPGGSITRRIVSAPEDPVGEYGRSLVGRHMPLDRTPILAQVAETGAALFLDNLPTRLAGAPGRATGLGASMERARVVRSAWCPVRTDGVLTHVLAVTGRDLTEHDFVAVQLLAAQLGAALHLATLRRELVAKERLAALGEMAAVMAHEVRNPLSVVFNAVANLRRGPADASLLAIVQEEAERLQRLVTDLLDFSRPATVQWQREDVAAIVRHAAHAASTEPMVDGVKRAIVVTRLPGPLVIETDPALVHRALVNLLVNALQNVSADGEVTIAIRLEERVVAIVVHNDGRPVALDVARRLFEPFFTTRAAGTGLGLAVVRRIANDLGGSVGLEPSPRGATFVLRIPLERPGGAPRA